MGYGTSSIMANSGDLIILFIVLIAIYVLVYAIEFVLFAVPYIRTIG